MKLLLMAALRSSKHLSLALFTLFSLILLTLANELEMITIGVMANSSYDFFTLFGKENSTRVSLQEVEEGWKKIDSQEQGTISKKDAARYMSAQAGGNPLVKIFRGLSAQFDFETRFLSLIFFIVCVALFKAICLFTSRYTTQLLSIRVTRDLRFQYFQHIQSLPMSFYQRQNLGSLTTRALGDAGQIASSLNSCLTNYLQTPFTIVTALAVCFYFSWKLSFVIFLGLPLIIFPVIFLTKRIKRVSRQMQKNQESFTSVLLDFLSGIHTVKLFAMETFSLKKYKEQNDRMARLESKNAKYNLLTRPVLHLITSTCLATVVLFGLYILHLDVAQLLVYCGFLYLFYEPVKKFAEENSNIQRGIVSAERMFEVLNIHPAMEDCPNAIEMKGFKDLIEFDHVSFKYEEEWVLQDVTFSVKKGETVAIVGPTGAGKSTIVQLIPRLFDVQEGEIRIDGIPIQKYKMKSLREQIAIVPQKPFLFFDTVSENISFGRDFSKEEVEEASRRAYAHEFIERLPEQYDTLLAETGKKLSGGQQQRLAIARALVKQAPILILDEATSALDALSENRIKRALTNIHGETTQIIIAHRLSTIEHADKILYLEHGRKVAEGTLQQLLETSLAFRAMWEAFHQSSQNINTIYKK